MAYLKDIVMDCEHGGCIKQARREVFNRYNSSCGKYCVEHARKRLKEIEREEKPREAT